MSIVNENTLDQTSGPALNFKCKWCGGIYKGAMTSRANLFNHWDWDQNSTACGSRQNEIKNGAKLLLTEKEKQIQESSQERSTLKNYIQSGRYDPKVLNQILVMWLVHSSLPWTRIKDFFLGVAFDYVKRGIQIYSRVWAATEAHRLYLNLKNQVMEKIKVWNHFINNRKLLVSFWFNFLRKPHWK